MPFILASFLASGSIAGFIWTSNLSDTLKIDFSISLAFALLAWLLSCLGSEYRLRDISLIISIVIMAGLFVASFLCKSSVLFVLCLIVLFLQVVRFLHVNGFLTK